MKRGNVLKALKAELKKAADGRKAKILSGFFKTGQGEYAEGDIFLGITVPKTRLIAKKYGGLLTLSQTSCLLLSPFHEERLAALLILKEKYMRGNDSDKSRIFRLYLANTRFINNWDLVDLSAEHIIGAWLKDKSRQPLLRLIKSKLIWERRIALLASFHYIKAGESALTLKLVKEVLDDKHDLMHKAAGWMLREVGKRCSRDILKRFLKANYNRLPRTALRYAIEHFPEKERMQYLRGNFKAWVKTRRPAKVRP
jgi:3-methyladenine DNA glycosylase AlkD